MKTLPIPNFPGYSVRSDGFLIGKLGKPLVGGTTPSGYKYAYVGFWPHGKTLRVHRVVADVFLGPIPKGMQVNHINGIKADNRVENLEIVSASENILHSYHVLMRKPSINPNPGERNGNAKFKDADIREIRRLYRSGVVQTKIAEMFNCKQPIISRIVRLEAWVHVGD